MMKPSNNLIWSKTFFPPFPDKKWKVWGFRPGGHLKVILLYNNCESFRILVVVLTQAVSIQKIVFFLTLLVDPFLYEDKNLKMQSTNWVWLKSQGREKKMAILRLVFMAWAVFWFRCKISRIKKRIRKNRKTIAIKNILRNMSTVVSVRKIGRGSHSQCLLTYIFF